MNNCPFCKMASGEWASLKIYEDDFTIVIMDIAKDVDGHILVIPKQHCENILDCDYETWTHTMNTVKKISNHLVDNCGYDGVDIMNENGASAGQTVFHLHIHLIPRQKMTVWEAQVNGQNFQARNLTLKRCTKN